MKHKIVAIFLAILTFFGGGISVHADEIQPTPTPKAINFFKAPFSFIMKKFEEQKGNKETNKNLRNEIIEQRKTQSEITPSPTPLTLIDYLTQAIARMDHIANRIDSRIRKTEASGSDLTDAKETLVLAREQITLAQKATATIASSTSEMALSKITLLEQAVTNISDARSLLEKTTQLINTPLEKNVNESNSK